MLGHVPNGLILAPEHGDPYAVMLRSWGAQTDSSRSKSCFVNTKACCVYPTAFFEKAVLESRWQTFKTERKLREFRGGSNALHF